MILLCGQCGQPYRAEDNRHDACRYHPGEMMDYERLFRAGPGLPGDFWGCCGGVVESGPFDVPGCAIGPHCERPQASPSGMFQNGLQGHQEREWRSAAAARAARRIVDFLRGSESLGDGELWRALLVAVRALEETAPSAAIGLLSSAEFPTARWHSLVPFVRGATARSAISSSIGHRHEDNHVAPRDWRLDRLFATFPGLLPGSRGAGTPVGPVSGRGRSRDQGSGGDPLAEVTLTLTPSRDFVIRLREAASEQELVRGVLKGAVHLVTPPALACEITLGVECAPRVTEDAPLHEAAYRAFEDAARQSEWTFASPCPAVEPPTANGNLEIAYERIAAAFEFPNPEAGI